jgi:CDP-2,3-bis-(O-geranylgeranyl)-sn-glycerol synthase
MTFDLLLRWLGLLALLAAANGAPIIGRAVLGERFGWPLDGGVRFLDGRPLFGPTKTVRGIVLALVLTPPAAALLGLGWTNGLSIAAAAMAGDLLSSFTKRRLGLPPSSRALGLDQVPESLLPLLLVREPLALSAAEILGLVAAFVVLELLLSRLLYRLHIREQPY